MACKLGGACCFAGFLVDSSRCFNLISTSSDKHKHAEEQLHKQPGIVARPVEPSFDRLGPKMVESDQNYRRSAQMPLFGRVWSGAFVAGLSSEELHSPSRPYLCLCVSMFYSSLYVPLNPLTTQPRILSNYLITNGLWVFHCRCGGDKLILVLDASVVTTM